MTKHLSLVLPLTLVAPLVAVPALAQTPPPAPPVTDVVAPPPAGPQAAPPSDATPPAPPPAPHHPQPWITAEFSTLRLLHEKGVLSQAEYDSAMRDLVDTSGVRTGDDFTFAVGKFATTFYGFTELDAIWDSTQAFSDTAGGSQVPLSTAYAGANSRTQFGIRNSRFGLRVKAPETPWFRASAQLEMDFEGATLPIGSGQPYYGTEAAFFNNPTFRVRHAFLKFETPVVDLLFGQTWQLYGWQGMAFPNTVEIQGVPGELYSRTAQIRISHTFKSEVAEFELAVAAARPPQRNSAVPDGQGGMRLAFPKWTGMQTTGATGTQIAPISLGLSGDVRKFAVANWAASASKAVDATGYGVAVDLFAPLIPATKGTKGNSLSITGEFSYSKGLADMYTGLTGGVPIAPALPNPMMKNPAPTYTPDVDPGLASYTVDPNGNATLNLVQWTSFNVGAQYYFPVPDGRLFLSGNYSRTMSSNTNTLLGVADPTNPANAAAVTTARGKIRDHEDWFDVNVMGDPYPGVRLGIEYAHFADTYVDGTQGTNHRVQFSGFYIF